MCPRGRPRGQERSQGLHLWLWYPSGLDVRRELEYGTAPGAPRLEQRPVFDLCLFRQKNDVIIFGF